MDWLTNTPFLTKERGFLLQIKKLRVFYADPCTKRYRFGKDPTCINVIRSRNALKSF